MPLYPNPPVAAPAQITGATAGSAALNIEVTGDTAQRLTIGADGKHSWSDGSGSVATTMAEIAGGGLVWALPGPNSAWLFQGGSLNVDTVGKGLGVAEGSNAKQGTATLTAGSAVVANTAVTANSRIFLTSNADGGTPGWLRVSARTAGTSFTITSSSGTDTSTVAYEIFEPG